MGTQWSRIGRSSSGASSRYATAAQRGLTIDTAFPTTPIGDVSATVMTIHLVPCTLNPCQFLASSTGTNDSGGTPATTTGAAHDGTWGIIGKGVCLHKTL